MTNSWDCSYTLGLQLQSFFVIEYFIEYVTFHQVIGQ